MQIMQNEKIGIMGGTFDPIHNGHLALAQKAYEQFALDKVIFIPSGISYLKKDRNVLEASKRLKLVDLSIQDYKYFESSTIEIDRGGNSYTYETLEELNTLYKNASLYFILGADSLLYIDKWVHPELIFKYCTVICAVRDDADLTLLKAKAKELEKLGAKVLFLDMEPINISSTKIREALQSNQSIEEFVPKQVSEYILQEHLYEKY